MRKKISVLLILTALMASASVSCGTTVERAETPDSPVADITTEAAGETDTALTTSADSTEASTEAETGEETTAEETTEEETIEIIELTDTPKVTEAPTEAPTPAPTEAPTEAPQAAGSFTNDDMHFVYGGAQATVLVDAGGLVSALGAPSDVQQAAGCLSNGLDQKIYSYNGITVSTYVDGSQEIIYDIYITSSAYSTPKGLTVGSPESDIERLYGTGYEKSGSNYCFYGSSGQLYITTSGGSVTSIDYYADV